MTNNPNPNSNPNPNPDPNPNPGRILVTLAKEAHGETSPEHADALVAKAWAIVYSSVTDVEQTNFKSFHALHRAKKTARAAPMQGKGGPSSRPESRSSRPGSPESPSKDGEGGRTTPAVQAPPEHSEEEVHAELMNSIADVYDSNPYPYPYPNPDLTLTLTLGIGPRHWLILRLQRRFGRKRMVVVTSGVP